MTGDASIDPSASSAAASAPGGAHLDEREDVFAHRLDLGKTTVTLTTLGSRVRHLRRVEADIRRILERALSS